MLCSTGICILMSPGVGKADVCASARVKTKVVFTQGVVHECTMLLLPDHIHEPLLQDVLGPSPATDPLLASLERAMEDPMTAEVKKDNAQGGVDDQQHNGEGEFFSLLSCTSVA